MTSLAPVRIDEAEEDLLAAIPDDLFADLPSSAPAPVAAAPPAPAPPQPEPAKPTFALLEEHAATHEEGEDDLATLPELASINGCARQIAEIQAALDGTRAEVETLRAELREKATALRALAGALEAI